MHCTRYLALCFMCTVQCTSFCINSTPFYKGYSLYCAVICVVSTLWKVAPVTPVTAHTVPAARCRLGQFGGSGSIVAEVGGSTVAEVGGSIVAEVGGRLVPTSCDWCQGGRLLVS